MKRLKRAKKFKDPKLAFVQQYEYTLGVDDLVPFGAAQYVLFSSCPSLYSLLVFFAWPCQGRSTQDRNISCDMRVS